MKPSLQRGKHIAVQKRSRPLKSFVRFDGRADDRNLGE